MYLNQESSLDILDYDTKLLRMVAHLIYKKLTAIINVSLRTGNVPHDWTFARTTPMYKCEELIQQRRTTGQYLLYAILLNSFEKEVQTQLLDYLTPHDMINVDQFAFPKNQSTHCCLSQIIDDWYV